MKDLIERLEELRGIWEADEDPPEWDRTLNEAITALSPVQPEEVKGIVKCLNAATEVTGDLHHEREAAGLIERLARENVNLHRMIGDTDQNARERFAEYRQRIEELEKRNTSLISQWVQPTDALSLLPPEDTETFSRSAQQMNRDDLIERIDNALNKGIGNLSPILGKILEDCRAVLSPVLPEEIEQFCKELLWFRGCDNWELDEFLIEINADRAKAVDLIERLARRCEFLEQQNDKITQWDVEMDLKYQQRIAELDLRRNELKSKLEKAQESEAMLIAENKKLLAQIAGCEKEKRQLIGLADDGVDIWDDYVIKGRQIAEHEKALELVAKRAEIIGKQHDNATLQRFGEVVRAELKRIRGMK